MKGKVCTLFLFAAIGMAQDRSANDWGAQMAIGNAAYGEGRYAEAEHSYREALRLAEAAGVQDKRLAQLLAELGALRSVLNGCEDGRKFGLRAVRLYETLAAADSAEVMDAWQSLAGSYFCLQQFWGAEQALRKGLTLAETAPGIPKSKTAEILASLAAVYISQRNSPAAMATARRAAGILRETPETDPRTRALILNNLGAIYQKLGRADEAETKFLEAHEAAQAIPKNGELARLSVVMNLAFSALSQKRYAVAVARFSQAVELIDRGTAILDYEVEKTLRGYAISLEKAGRKDTARQIKARGTAWRRDHPAAGPAEWTVSLTELHRKK